MWKRSSVIVVCGRARCERWPRPGLHPTQRTRIETHLSRMNSSWSSIQSSFSEHLSRPPTGVGLMGARRAHRSGGGNSRIAKRGPILVKTARSSFARALLNCSERSAGSHGLDRSKSRPDCPVTWPNGRKIGRLGRKGSRKPVHPVRGVSVLGLESLSFSVAASSSPGRSVVKV